MNLTRNDYEAMKTLAEDFRLKAIRCGEEGDHWSDAGDSTTASFWRSRAMAYKVASAKLKEAVLIHYTEGETS